MSSADLLFELRTEELPALDVRKAATALRDALVSALNEAGLESGESRALWTPRRLTVAVSGLAARSPDRTERMRGPPLRAAFAEDGTPTGAAQGFARKNGVSVDDLKRDETHVHAVVSTPGRGAAEIVAEILPTLPALVPWRKRMQWGAPDAFARPIRGVVALLGDDVVECEVTGLATGRETRGHPFLAPGAIELASSDVDAYVESLRAASVLADADERAAAVLAAARALRPDLSVRDSLLEEVTNLVEWPSAVEGQFESRFLDLPPRLLTTVMEHHQRFFPVTGPDGALLDVFIAILDRSPDSAEFCRPGFERVLVPRLHDAAFFMEEDAKRGFVERLDALEDVVYHRKLGSLREKAARLEALAPQVAAMLGHDDEAAARAARAGLLAKCDLVTLMVGEFPELQGHVGSVYAAAAGEPADVATALDWQYRHDFDDAEAPDGVALSLLLAENLDVLASFGTRVGLPTGSADPFGLRRAALAIVDACERWAPELRIFDALRVAGGDDAVEEYLRTRVARKMRGRGVAADRLDAVVGYESLGQLVGRLDDLEALSEAPGWTRLLEVAERCRNITRKSDAPHAAVRPELFAEPAESALFAVWEPLRATLPKEPKPLARADAERIASELADPLHEFFEQVFVNAKEADLRTNRHALLRAIDAALLRFVDLCRIVR